MARELVRLVSHTDGTYGVHHPDTGRLLMEVEKREPAPLSRAASPEDLGEQIETATHRREQERSQELVAGLVVGLAVVAGFALGWLVFHR